MEQQITVGDSTRPTISGRDRLRSVGVVLLVVVFYIHLALFLTMIGTNPFLGTLFLLNAIGTLMAVVGVQSNSRWMGWALGIVMAGGAAVVKLTANTIPSAASLRLGVYHTSAKAKHAPVLTSPVLPPFLSRNALGAVAIVIELTFVLVATGALVGGRRTVTTTNA